MWESGSLHRMPGPTYTGSRDLNTMFEENESEIHKSESMMSFTNQALDPTMSDTLGFLRSTHTKTNAPLPSSFHHSHNVSSLPQPSMPAMRRSRAGTMPSFANLPEESLIRPQAPLLLTPAVSNRHRSGSLNMPAMQLSFDNSPFSSPWTMSRGNTPDIGLGQHRMQPPPSPSTEQLLQNDHELSIARTLRSLGLDDETQASIETQENNRSLYHQQQQQQQQQTTSDFHMSDIVGNSNSNGSINLNINNNIGISNNANGISNGNGNGNLISNGSNNISSGSNSSGSSSSSRAIMSANRNRSYSVNAAARYQPEILPPIIDQSRIGGNSNINVNVNGNGNGNIGNIGNVGNLGGTNAQTKGFASSLEGFTRKQTRPRASSMGRMEAPRSNVSNLWSMQRTALTPLRDEDFSFDGSDINDELSEQNVPLSLGDTELLAKLFHGQPFADPILSEANELGLGRNHLAREPSLQFSQSTPTFHERNLQASLSSSPLTQAPTRSLWVGNIDTSVTIDALNQIFTPFGPIESIRLLIEKECAFVNFHNIENAVQAKQNVLELMGGKIGNCIARIGYGKVDGAVPESNTLQPTRALWLGNIPSSTTSSTLQRIFSSFGVIESIRVLPHKNCGFINFEFVSNAAAAKDALLQNKLAPQGFVGVRVGFAKVPPSKSSQSETTGGQQQQQNQQQQPQQNQQQNQQPQQQQNQSNQQQNQHQHHQKHHQHHQHQHQHQHHHQRSSDGESDTSDGETWLTELSQIMKEYGVENRVPDALKALQGPGGYFTSIPSVPELGSNRMFDGARLRDIRKKLDAATQGGKEVEAIALDCMDEIAELSSDYIGNTVVQRLFEKCAEDTKTSMLVRIAPHLASISVHKNGTWAAQKIIDTAKTPAQIRLISDQLKPYVPPLLLDQFGNYAVQCCLRLGEGDNQFIFDAIVEKLLHIAQGRFGARAIRGTLESQYATIEQQKYVASVFTQNAYALATNANGVLLLSWLIEASKIEKRMSMIASRFVPHLQMLCTHKLGSQMILKLINQNQDTDAQEMILTRLLTTPGLLTEIITDQTRGLAFIQKAIASTFIPAPQHQDLKTKVQQGLVSLNSPAHKKLLTELAELEEKEAAKEAETKDTDAEDADTKKSESDTESESDAESESKETKVQNKEEEEDGGDDDDDDLVVVVVEEEKDKVVEKTAEPKEEQ